MKYKKSKIILQSSKLACGNSMMRTVTMQTVEFLIVKMVLFIDDDDLVLKQQADEAF